MGMLEKAREELKLLRGGNTEPDEMQDKVEEGILKIIEIFSEQGHSGFSAAYAIPIIIALLKHEPITPLTGADDEWFEFEPGKFQNKRWGVIFKDKDRFNGQAYWIEGRVFSEDGGQTWFTSADSFVPITFPFMKREPERIIFSR